LERIDWQANYIRLKQKYDALKGEYEWLWEEYKKRMAGLKNFVSG